MIVYRIARRRYASDLMGTEAALHPGRWNKRGTPVLYAGESIEIALLELIVNVPPMMVPDLDVLTIEIPDDSITVLSVSDFPENWSRYPAPTVLSEIGAQWVQAGKTVSLKVPSCIIPTAHNFILNSNHKDFLRVKILDHSLFHFDPRLTS